VSAPAAIDVDRAEKRIKTLFGWLLYRRLSLPLSLRLAQTSIRPAHITAFGLALGLSGAALLGLGSYGALVAGAILANLAKLMDAVDGEVARAKGLDSKAGYVADGLTDRLRDVAVIVGLGVGAARHGSDAALAWTLAAVVGYLAFFYVSGAFPSHWREVRSEADVDEKHMFRVAGALRLGAGDTLAVITLIGALANHPIWAVIAVAVAAPVATGLKVRRLFSVRPWDREES
jgi:phosphatidylglycerophosphate synthase